jgi:putative serine/threonine protein kinase
LIPSSQTPLERIEVSEFIRSPYLQVLTYPKPSLRTAKSRLSQLSELGVTHVAFGGRTKIGRLGVVGLGTVSVVVRATVKGEERALKIRRADANRPTMLDEFRLTQAANRARVGAYAYEATKDLLLLQLIEGEDIDDHFKPFGGVGTRGRIREVIHRLLNQCRKLDLVGLDHGQLSDLRQHVIMAGDEPYIIDFESSSMGRRPRNVTTAAQYLLIGGRSSPRIRKLLGLKKSYEPLLKGLKEYKRDMSDENYVKVLNSLGIFI